MADHFKDPNIIQPSQEGQSIKFSFAGTLAAIIRTAIDVGKGSLGSGTLPEWFKAIEFKNNLQRETYLLLSRSLIKACRAQLESRIREINKDDNGQFFYFDREIGFLSYDIKEGIAHNEYTLDMRKLDTPQAFPLLSDFKPVYKSWITETFPISEAHADVLTSDFPDYFAYCFHLELHKHIGQYPAFLKCYTNPFKDHITLTLAREQYKTALKKKYNQPALGEVNIALSDVYIELDFLVYDAIFSKEKREALKELEINSGRNHFLATDFKGSIHDYLLYHFLKKKQSKAIGERVEESRLLILMGQPGHGKSSFCYRAIYDLLNDSAFGGNTFFVRLQEAEHSILHTPLSSIAETASIKEFNIGFRELIEQSHDQANIIFLDGLDEFYMTKSLSDADVLQFLNNCKKLIDKYKNLYLIITSRFNYVETSKLYNEDCLLFSLGTLSIAQQCKLVEKYRFRIGDNQACNLTSATIKYINKQWHLRHVKELIELPILLQMILISEINIHDAGSKAQIYDKLFTTILDRKWDKDKRLKKYRAGRKFEKHHLRNYLSFLAYKIFQYNKGYLHKSEVEVFEETQTFVRKRLRVEYERGELRDVLKDILTSFYIKEAKKNEGDRRRGDEGYDYAIEFLHKSLYEFLACEHLWISTKKFFLERDRDDPEEYKEHKLEDVQQELQALFAQTRMTTETMGYMKEIIFQDTKDQSALAERMNHYLPRLLKRGFLYDYKSRENIGGRTFLAEQQVINVFHNFWSILGNLNIYQVNFNRYLNSKWEHFKHEFAVIDKIDELIAAYKKDVLFRTTYRNNHKKESEAFQNWLNDEKVKKKNRKLYYEYWVRSFLLRKSRSQIIEHINAGLRKEKTNIERFIRLLSIEKGPLIPLNFADLHGTDLSSAILHGAIFRSAILRYAIFRGANLSSADLSSADLSHADLSRADLSRVVLRRAILRFATLSDSVLRDAELSRATLNRADLSGAELSGAVLHRADLHRANLRRATLNRATLRHADLSRATLNRADLHRADLSGADLSGADLSGADLSGAVLNGADLSGANLSGAVLSSANLSGAVLCSAKTDTINWLNDLKKHNVIGLNKILEKYVVLEFSNTIIINGQKQKAFVIQEKKQEG